MIIVLMNAAHVIFGIQACVIAFQEVIYSYSFTKYFDFMHDKFIVRPGLSNIYMVKGESIGISHCL